MLGKKSEKDRGESSKKEKQVALSSEEYAALKEKAQMCDEHKEQLLRARADFDNTRKRLEKDKEDFVKFANSGFIKDLLNILDDLERSIEVAKGKHGDFETFTNAIEMISAHIYELLRRNGVTPIQPEGEVFDPYMHEVLMQVETDKHPEDTIIEVMQKGYKMNDRVLRTAKVATAKSPQKENKKEKEEEE